MRLCVACKCVCVHARVRTGNAVCSLETIADSFQNEQEEEEPFNLSSDWTLKAKAACVNTRRHARK